MRRSLRGRRKTTVSELWLAWLIKFSVVVLSATAKSGTVPECTLSVEREEVTAGGREGLRATCYLRTLRSELLQHSQNVNNTLSAVNHSMYVTSLNLHCSKQVVFQSDLQPAAFSAFPILVELVIDSCKFKHLPKRAFAGLSQLRHLVINTHHQDWPGAALSLGEETLTELPRLERLDLSSSELWQLPPGAICSLYSLNTLNLTNNKIHRISDIGFSQYCDAPITHLLLSHNKVDELPTNALPTPHLHSLHLDNNKLSRIDDYAFRSLSDLEELILSFNKLVALPKTAFLNLYQLRSLDLANNSLSSLPPALFTSLEHLQALNLSYNQLKFSNSNPEPFIGLIRLVVLDLSYNEITLLGDRVFYHLYTLQALFMSHNSISHLNDDVFSTLTNLYTLDLSHNTMTTLDSGALRGLSVLTHLFLNDNSFEDISDKSFYNCSSLQKLSMSNNKLSKVPKAISYLTLLQNLDLSNNSIKELEQPNFRGLSNLKLLSLNHNSIGNITMEVIPRLPKLEYLDLSHNNIDGVEHRSFEPLTELISLNLSHNSLHDINGLVLSLYKLQYLNVSRNALTWFDYSLIPVDLKELDISYNQVKVLDNYYEVHGKLKLRKLIASHNNLTAISPTSLSNGIEYVDLSHNSIDYVSSKTFLHKGQINLINFENNLLTLLEESSLSLPPRSSEASSASPPLLLLSNNPLKCDCGAEWLSRAARDANGDKMLVQQQQTGSLLPRLGKIADVKCSLPGLWENVLVPLVSVHQHQFLCTYRRHCFTLCHCCDFDACDCEQTCPDSCSCYHDHSWGHNIVDCGNQNWTVMPKGVPMDVTEAYLDGNNMGNLTSHALIGRKNLRVLYLNNSNIIDIQNRTFNGLQNLQVLRLDHNYLQYLRGFEFVLLHNLLELYLNDNKIVHISNTTFTSLRTLEVLRLENNNIIVFPVWNLGLNPFLVEVGLYHNKWSCECNFLSNLRAWLESNRIKATNVDEIKCYHNTTGEVGPHIFANTPGHCDHYVSTTRINQLMAQDIMITSSILAVLVFVIVIILVVVFYRRRIKLWAAGQYSKHLFEKSSSYLEEREKLFDVFISHSNKDCAWVYGVLTAELETRGYRTCGAYRNCSSPTAPIVAQALSEGIACSQKLLIVLSKGLIDSEWCKYDFKSTHVDATMRLSKKNIILINLENIPKSEQDSELSAIIKKASYSLKPRDPRFWDRLRRALPSLRHRRRYDDALGKSISSPLMTTSVPPAEVIKFTVHPNKNLTLNPYWETAITSNIPEWNMKKPDLGAPPWVEASPVKAGSSPVSASTRPTTEGGEHTYMSVSECEINPGSSSPAGPSGTSAVVQYGSKPSSSELNGSVAKYATGQGSPPLLSLHHQHLVHDQIVNFQEVPQYQTPLNPLSSPNSGAQTLPQNNNRSSREQQRLPTNIYSSTNSTPPHSLTSSRAGNAPNGHQKSPMPGSLPSQNDYLGEEFGTSQARREKASPSADDHYRWIYQTPENLPTSNNGQTYYV